jgi:hypothetical protein
LEVRDKYPSLDFMLRHKDRFDDAMMRKISEGHCNLPPGGDSSKVRKGGVGGHKQELTLQIAGTLDAIWFERVAPTIPRSKPPCARKSA